MMQYLDLRRQLGNFVLFSLADIRKLEPTFSYRRLYEWQQKDYIIKIRRGYYAFSDLNLDEEVLYVMANRLYGPSYVSLETALRHYNLIPESVYTITSVSTLKTTRFSSLANFNYQKLQPSLYFGYRLVRASDQNYKMAEPEKAVLDYLYFHPEMSEPSSLAEWRFNAAEFKSLADMTKFATYLKSFDSPSLTKRAGRFVRFLEASSVNA